MPYIIGIDLGTTNTAVAVLENGRPRVIEDDRGYTVLPSVISAKGEGRFVVGQAAHNLILTRPDRTVYAVKRLLGRRFDSPEVQRVIKRVGYPIQEAPDGGVQVQVGDTWMTPSEVAAVVLQVARGIAEKALGEPVEEAVITVPAHFNHAQRKATLEAATIAGLRCDRIINEPTAAALAYGHRRNTDRTLVIFDLGGGTFDVSVLRLSGGLYEILATNGDTFLGGEDFDYRVVDHLVDALRARTGVDVREDRAALQRLKDAAERAKCELSFSDRANIVVPHVARGQNLETVLTRTELEDLCRSLVERCVEVARDAVAEAGLVLSDVDEVILVGGQTRMPLVREAVAGLFGREPSRSVHPEEAVAIGAAVHAASLGDVEGTPAVLLDVTPFDLGIDAAGGMFSRIVQKNARVPCSETRTFATMHDNQDTVRVTVRQGESRVAEENEFIGEFLFEGLPPAPRMQTKVAVTFRIDANGMLHVTAHEPYSREKRNISIRNYADRNRTILRPAAPSSPTAPGPGPAAASREVKKKAGFFDTLFGSKKATKPAEKSKTPAAAASAPGGVAALPVAPDPAFIEPPPVIAPLPVPTFEPLDELEPLEATPVEIDSLSELDAFEMGDDFTAMEDDLYDPASASFGLAGAHQVGEAVGDPFSDLGHAVVAALDSEEADAPGEFPAAEDPAWELPGADGLDASDLFGGVDEGDLFGGSDTGVLFGSEDQDPPTNPGLRFPNTDAAPSATEAGPSADAMTGLTFEHLVEPPEADASIGDDFGFALADAEEEATSGEDVFGFSMAEIEIEVPEAPAPAPRSPAAAGSAPTVSSAGATDRAPERPRDDATEIFRRPSAPLDADSDFAFPMLGDEAPAEEPRMARKPARVKLQYRERESLVAEYSENLRKGGALIKTAKPLAIGRECLFEISGPGLDTPLVIPARVSRVLEDGMEVEYRVDARERASLLAQLGT